MQDETSRHQFGRRSFLKNAALAGLSATAGAAFLEAIPPLSAHAASEQREFVRQCGREFSLDHRTFYFGGTNNYYLHYQSHFMIDDVLKDASAMQLAVLRMWGFLDGTPSNGIVLQPTPGVYPEDNYERFDYTVWRAGQVGLKLVIPLVNNWNDFGGMNQYVTWFNASKHDDFYTNEQIKTAYKNYVHHFLLRKNRYTGLRMIDDPTIMTWELANEPRCESDPTGNTLLAWAHEMSMFIKNIDRRHLVSVGDEGFYNYAGNSDWTRNGGEGVDWKRLLSLPTIDYGTFHLYPDGWGKDAAWATQWISDHIHDGHSIGKPVVLEEYGWLDLSTRDAIYQSWTDTVYKEGGNGDQFWILTGLQDDGTLYPNYDGYRVTYPSSTATILANHAIKMRQKAYSI